MVPLRGSATGPLIGLMETPSATSPLHLDIPARRRKQSSKDLSTLWGEFRSTKLENQAFGAESREAVLMLPARFTGQVRLGARCIA